MGRHHLDIRSNLPRMPPGPLAEIRAVLDRAGCLKFTASTQPSFPAPQRRDHRINSLSDVAGTGEEITLVFERDQCLACPLSIPRWTARPDRTGLSFPGC